MASIQEKEKTRKLNLGWSRNHILMIGKHFKCLSVSIHARFRESRDADIEEQRSEAQTISERSCKIFGTAQTTDVLPLNGWDHDAR